MKTLRAWIGILAFAAPLFAGEARDPAPNPAFEKLKSLAGEWDGKENGKPFHVSYRVVSSGTAVMETIDGPDAMQMITVYTPDRGTVLMTHYCSMGNQPRMRAKGLENGKLAFAYVDAGNLASPKDPHMSGLVLTFTDSNHLGADWTHFTGGQDEISHFAYTRQK